MIIIIPYLFDTKMPNRAIYMVQNNKSRLTECTYDARLTYKRYKILDLEDGSSRRVLDKREFKI